jgi:hypothetical protein
MAVKKTMKKSTPAAAPTTTKATPPKVVPVAGTTGTYNGYCVKCKGKKDFEGAVVVSKTGMNMAQGPCPTCGTKVSRILGKAAPTAV